MSLIKPSSTKAASVEHPYLIEFPPPTAANDDSFLTELTSLINNAYTTNIGIFKSSHSRKTQPEVKQDILNGKLAVAKTSESSQTSPGDMVGSICISTLDSETGAFSTLVTRSEVRGSGAGRQLVGFAEAHCRNWGARKMRIDTMVPKQLDHPMVKTQEWYERMGYKLVEVVDFAERFPDHAKLLLMPIEYRIYEKRLVDPKEDTDE